MKKLSLILIIACVVICNPIFSQRYRSAADTIKLNQEYSKVTAALIDLNNQLTSAQNNLPGYKNRADNAVANAEASAEKNKAQATIASGDNIKDAKRAKRESRKALSNAKHARTANKKEEGQDKRIENLKTDIQRKQDRLQELELMRSEIRSKG